MAFPPALPGYQASTIAATRPAQGIATPALVSKTTAVLGLAAATASISASWLPSRAIGTSIDSLDHWVPKTIATSAPLAAAAAAAGSEPSMNVIDAFGAAALSAASGD